MNSFLSRLLNDLKRGGLHHAYGFSGDREEIRVILIDFFENNLEIKTKGNPDFYHITEASFGVDSSRKLKDLHILRSSDGGRKIFLIEMDAITHEAQNALLKMFEEPQAGTHFFIIIPSIELLLPTLRSRLSIHVVSNVSSVSGQSSASKDRYEKEAKTFLKLGLKEKIKFVDDLAALVSDEKATKQDVLGFLNGLEIVIGQTALKKGQTKGIDAVLTARSYMQDRAPSIKQLLEYVALNVA